MAEAGKDFREEIGSHHGRYPNLYGSLLELFVVVDLKDGILYVSEGQIDAVEEDGAFRGQGKLLLAAVEQLYAKFCFQLLDGNRDVRL